MDWLQQNAPGYAALSDPERNAIMQFSLLWSLFEAKALGTRGSARAIAAAAKRWADQGLLTTDSFREAISYFRNRYVAEGVFTHHFAHLHLRPADNPALVKSVLAGEVDDPASVAEASLIIVYRFRNNLFHGVKWAYEIVDQLGNFEHANAVLMQSMEMHEQSMVSA
jgi:hypothetical protein